MKTGKSPEHTSAPHSAPQTRRSFLDRLGVSAVLAAIAGQATLMLRALSPNVLYEPPRRVKIGRPDEFPEGVTFLESQRLFVFKNRKSFHSISAECTHLGCTVKMVQLAEARKVEVAGKTEQMKQEFHCPCHGSKYDGAGTNYAGPAPAPLPWYRLEVAPEDGQLVVDLNAPVRQDFRLNV